MDFDLGIFIWENPVLCTIPLCRFLYFAKFLLSHLKVCLIWANLVELTASPFHNGFWFRYFCLIIRVQQCGQLFYIAVWKFCFTMTFDLRWPLNVKPRLVSPRSEQCKISTWVLLYTYRKSIPFPMAPQTLTSDELWRSNQDVHHLGRKWCEISTWLLLNTSFNQTCLSWVLLQGFLSDGVIHCA